MLEDWIYKGQINDPYNEFMIYEDKEIVKEKLKDNFNEKYPFFYFRFKFIIDSLKFFGSLIFFKHSGKRSTRL